jgi:hypothetical protein
VGVGLRTDAVAAGDIGDHLKAYFFGASPGTSADLANRA